MDKELSYEYFTKMARTGIIHKSCWKQLWNGHCLPTKLDSGLGGSLNGQNVLRDFLGFRGTALSAPLPFMLTQLMITLLVLRSGRFRLISVAALTFVGLFYTLAQAGEPIVLRLLSPGGFNLAQALAFIVNEASAIAMLIMGIRAWRIVRP